MKLPDWLLASILGCECVFCACVCEHVCVSKVLFLVYSGLPALQWVYSFRVLQRTGLMTSSRDMKRLCPPATRNSLGVYVCLFCLYRTLITMPPFLHTLSKTCLYMPFNTLCNLSSRQSCVKWSKIPTTPLLTVFFYRHHTIHVSP